MNTSPILIRTAFLLVTVPCLLALQGCGQIQEDDGLTRIVLQTDWYAQPEHGGFYQALAEGYYEERGLKVTINPGGPNAMVSQRVATGNAHFAISRSDEVMIHASRGVPLVIVAALMQRDPQAILVHEESGIETFEDLDGRAIMAGPGSAFIQMLERIYDINIGILPLDFGMSRFIANKDFIQQCFITNEPYYVKQQGANPRTLLLADSGFDPYRVIFSRRDFVQRNPEAARAFVEASIQGWQSYMEGPRERANAMIAELNERMTEDFMAFSVNAMKEHKLVEGRAEDGETIGAISRARIAQLVEQLGEIGMIEGDPDPEIFIDLSYLPEDLRR